MMVYIGGTRHWVLRLKPDPQKSLELYSDASWCTRNSISGALMLYMGILFIGWWTRRQTSIALSSAEGSHETFSCHNLLTPRSSWLTF